MALADSIIGVESGGNPNATNPNSSASGLGQFIDSTWLSTIKAARPDIAAGKSDADLLALKTDPQLSREMTEAYANQNQAILSKAGVPVTPGTTYLAHFAGPGGAVKVLQADPNAPVGDVLGAAAVKANPFLGGMTAKDLQAWADRKMGASAAQPVAQPQPAPATPAAAPSAPLNIAPQQQPIFAKAPDQQTAPQALQPVPQADAAIAQVPALQFPQLTQIQFAQRRSPDLTRLRAALAQPPIFSRG